MRLDDAQQVPAPAALGLGAAPDEELDRVAARLRQRLRVAIVLVSLVRGGEQMLPGQSGLGPPWAQRRSIPLNQSLCRRVVRSEQPLIVEDARIDSRVSGELPGGGLGVVAYAGMPLTDGEGRTFGTLCAIDDRPRAWTPADLEVLEQVAQRCAAEVRWHLAWQDARRRQRRADELRRELQEALRQAQVLLRASQSLTGAQTVPELRDRIADLVVGDLAPSRVELVITEQASTQTELEDHRDPSPESLRPATSGQWAEFDSAAPLLTARCARERRLVHHDDLRRPDQATMDSTQSYVDSGLISVTCAPVLGPGGDVLAVLELGWKQPHPLPLTEQAVIAAIAGYVATALHGIRVLQRRISVGRELQLAMLTALPELPGLRTAARYLPAAIEDYVGGDWYDAFTLQAMPGCVGLVIGDVAGHNIRAATIMGQLRAMLRQACWQQADQGPASCLSALDHAAHAFTVDASGTAILAFLHPMPEDTGCWSLRWSNAGHPPPIVIDPDGGTRVLSAHDPLLGYPHLLRERRTEQHAVLRPGATLLLYTDGLVETPRTDIDRAIRTVARSTAEACPADPDTLAETVLSTIDPEHNPDDIALLIVQIPRAHATRDRAG